MSKRIVLLSDGTGNSSSKLFKTNVWRLFQALDLSNPDQQIAYYDDGVGTSSFKPLAILGGIFGVRPETQRHRHLFVLLPQPSTRRQDFRLRLQPRRVHDPRRGRLHRPDRAGSLRRQRRRIWRVMRRLPTAAIARRGIFAPATISWSSRCAPCAISSATSYSASRHSSSSIWSRSTRFEFLGVWDTVDAYGGPIEEITRAIDYFYWPLSMPDQFMNYKIGRACHALALEDERDAFRPVLWDDRYVRQDKQLYPVGHGWTPPTDAGSRQAAYRRRADQPGLVRRRPLRRRRWLRARWLGPSCPAMDDAACGRLWPVLPAAPAKPA